MSLLCIRNTEIQNIYYYSKDIKAYLLHQNKHSIVTVTMTKINYIYRLYTT